MLRTPARRRAQRDEQGLIAVMVALCAVILLLIVGVVVDLGLARDTRRQSQGAADASSLAGANVLYPISGTCTSDPAPKVPPCFMDAISAAKSYADVNFKVKPADWAACADTGHFYYPPGESPCISFTDNTLSATKPLQPTKVRVVVPVHDVTTGFGTLAGVNSIPVSSQARATLQPGTARSCGLCLLDPNTSSLGNGDVTVNGGSVHSNGTIDSGPNGHLTASPATNTISVVGTCPGNCYPAAQTGVQPIADPYEAILTLPPSLVGLTPKTTPCTQGPGIYPALELPNSNCTLSPGLYVLTGAWTMKNDTLLQGAGVTLYGTCGTTSAPTVCTTGQSGGLLDTKNGNSQLVAPTSGPNLGYAIIYDRQNVGGLNIQGNGDSFVTGIIYAPKALLEFPGNSSVTVTNGPIIVGSLFGNGNTGQINLVSSVGAALPSPPKGASLDQ